MALLPSDFFTPFDVSLFPSFPFGSSSLMPQQTAGQRMGPRLPAMNFDENDKEYIVQVDLPGMKPEDISLDYNEGSQVLTIKAEQKEEAGRERTRRSYTRSFSLPADANADDICACLEHGVLCVKLPKKAPPAPRKIPIKAQGQERAQIGATHHAEERKESKEEGAKVA